MWPFLCQGTRESTYFLIARVPRNFGGLSCNRVSLYIILSLTRLSSFRRPWLNFPVLCRRNKKQKKHGNARPPMHIIYISCLQYPQINLENADGISRLIYHVKGSPQSNLGSFCTPHEVYKEIGAVQVEHPPRRHVTSATPSATRNIIRHILVFLNPSSVSQAQHRIDSNKRFNLISSHVLLVRAPSSQFLAVACREVVIGVWLWIIAGAFADRKKSILFAVLLSGTTKVLAKFLPLYCL